LCNIKHVTPPNGSDNVYAMVDKSSKNVPSTNVGKGEGTFLPDQTYAVVDKARKRNFTCEVNVMNFRKPKHRYSDLNKICYIIPENISHSLTYCINYIAYTVNNRKMKLTVNLC
jgi:hypothetical protein